MGAVALDDQVVKSIGASGQISLGKEYAGRKVLVEMPEPGVWIIRTARVIPDNESWLHEKSVSNNLTKALKWSAKNPARESDPADLKAK